MINTGSIAGLVRENHGLAVVATLRADGSIQSSLVNAAVIDHPTSADPVAAFVTYGPVKLANLRARPHTAVTFTAGWRWATIEGSAEVIGPDDPHPDVDAERLRLLLREVFVGAGGTHDNWSVYDRVMLEQRRAVVLVRPVRMYGS